jgi:hypothetical protein
MTSPLIIRERGERWKVKLMYSPFLQVENVNTVGAA